MTKPDTTPAEERPEALHPGRSGYPVSTLELLGLTLPIGVPTGTPPMLQKGFGLKTFKYSEEIAIDKIRTRKKGSGNHPGKVVADVMAHMLTEWGGDSGFAQKSEKHRRNAMRSAFMSDILYAYVQLRVEAMGSVIGMKVECPACDHEWPWRTDLAGLEVEVIDRFEDLADKEYRLKNPIKFGEKHYDTVLVAPPTWAAVCDVSPNVRRGGTGQIKAQMIRSCVRGVKRSEEPQAAPLALGSAILNEMHKRDIEGLSGMINDDFPSVDLSMEIECPSCTQTFINRVQWNWDFFFSSSSLPSSSTH